MSSYEREELEKVISKYGDMVYRMAYIQVKNRDTADDIYQEVWIKLIRQNTDIEPEAHLKAWLLRTTINCCKDYWKSAWVQKIVRGKEPEVGEEAAVEQEGEHWVTKCVQRLPENFGLTLGDEEVVLDEIEPVNLDYERYLNDEKAEWKGANYYYNYQDFYDGLGIELPTRNCFEHTEISVHLVEEHNIGHIGVQFLYENEPYHMNGRFIISDVARDGLGYGEDVRAYEVYEYAEGEKAYFVKDADEYYQRVYFSTEQYVFQLFVENSDEGAEKAKEILEIIGRVQ